MYFPSANKRRRISSPPSTTELKSENGANDDLDTDTKLAILSSLHSDIAHDHLLELLISNDGNLEATITELTTGSTQSTGKSTSKPRSQSSISTYLPSTNPSSKLSKSRKTVPKGKTLHLYTPESIAAYTPCTLIPSFLPSQKAEALLRDLLAEAAQFPDKLKFRLFERTVTSPHTSCLYVPTEDLLYGNGGEPGEGGYKGGGDTGWFYNGGRVEGIRVFTELMKEVVPYVEEVVNREMERYWGVKLGEEEESKEETKRIPLLSPKRWRANAAFVNCYDGPQQSVGYHTDQLTYLGPMTTIASLSLGVAREFRVRHWGGLSEEELRAGKAWHDFYENPRRTEEIKEESGDVEEETEVETEAEGPIGIHLAHNSLLIMHAGTQEGWKHRFVTNPHETL